MEVVYNRAWYIEEKKERLGKYKESSGKVWEKTKCRSKKIRKVGYGRRKRL